MWCTLYETPSLGQWTLRRLVCFELSVQNECHEYTVYNQISKKSSSRALRKEMALVSIIGIYGNALGDIIMGLLCNSFNKMLIAV
jgi:hypothetical protein